MRWKISNFCMGNEEMKNCQDCKESFVSDSEDLSFYEKVRVPPPTFSRASVLPEDEPALAEIVS